MNEYADLLTKLQRERETWKHALLQRILESGWFWLGVGIAMFGLAMWVWG